MNEEQANYVLEAVSALTDEELQERRAAAEKIALAMGFWVNPC